MGALKRFIELQDEYDAYYFLADLHAVTVPQDPEQLRAQVRHVAASYVACGLDPTQATLFRQSDVSAHAELGWLLTTLTSMGELGRMTQFKDKSGKSSEESIGAGLFTYPSLMAADILLYQADVVPVGDDQKQHVELTRDLAERFNHRFGETFKVPEPLIPKAGARIMGLDDPTKKMSKSASSEHNYIALTDDADKIRNKIKKAVTDSGSEITVSEDKPALRNLLTIYSLLTDQSVEEIAADYAGKGYGDFKQDLAEVVVEALTPIKQRHDELINDPVELDRILADGGDKARAIADSTLDAAKAAMGL